MRLIRSWAHAVDPINPNPFFVAFISTILLVSLVGALILLVLVMLTSPLTSLGILSFPLVFFLLYRTIRNALEQHDA